ncbi:MAG: hypothetical protein ONA90_04770, partial [candidate division KSB1 bacterium]|nr:hypothetical protein [candidate division KSB1 bacterium]
AGVTNTTRKTKSTNWVDREGFQLEKFLFGAVPFSLPVSLLKIGSSFRLEASGGRHKLNA